MRYVTLLVLQFKQGSCELSTEPCQFVQTAGPLCVLTAHSNFCQPKKLSIFLFSKICTKLVFFLHILMLHFHISSRTWREGGGVGLVYAVKDVRMVRDATKQRTSLSLLFMRRRTGVLGVVLLSLPHAGCAGLHPAELGNSGPDHPGIITSPTVSS